MGKGSKPRPIEKKEQFASNWDNIFKKTPIYGTDEKGNLSYNEQEAKSSKKR